MNDFILFCCAMCSALVTGYLYGYWAARGIELYRSPVTGLTLTLARLASLTLTLFCLLNLPATRLILVMVFLAASGFVTFWHVTRRA
jgi:hypothetical protein